MHIDIDAGPTLQTTFEAFRNEIDAFNDRRERLIKTSRDVTALSKKVIFHLHRFSFQAPWPADDQDDTSSNTRLFEEAQKKLAEIESLLRACADKEGLPSEPTRPNDTMLRCERFLGASLEEWIEAKSFLYFLQYNALIPYDVVQAALTSDTSMDVYVTPMRYLLGLSDLTGELMRFAINAVASIAPLQIMEHVLTMQRTIFHALEPLAPYHTEIRKKQQVTLTSLRKVEDGT